MVRSTAMMEILFLFGALGWLLGSCWEYLGTLDAFPTILVAFAAVPLLSCADYLATLHRFELEGLDAQRGPVPPERFYWGISQGPVAARDGMERPGGRRGVVRRRCDGRRRS